MTTAPSVAQVSEALGLPIGEVAAAQEVQAAEVPGTAPAAVYQDGNPLANAVALAREGERGANFSAAGAIAKPVEMPKKGTPTVYDKIQKDGDTITVEDKRGKDVGKPTNAFDQVSFPHGKHIEDGLIPVDPARGINKCEDCHSNLPIANLVIKNGKVVGVTVDKAELKLPKVKGGIPVDMAYTLVQAALNKHCDACHKEVMKLAKNALKGNAGALAKLEAWLGKNLDLTKISAPITKKGAKECPGCHPGEGVEGKNIVKGREGVR